jgi:hypothetical protein
LGRTTEQDQGGQGSASLGEDGTEIRIRGDQYALLERGKGKYLFVGTCLHSALAYVYGLMTGSSQTFRHRGG